MNVCGVNNDTAMERTVILKKVLLHLLFLIAAAQGMGQSRTITYKWLNEPCMQMINCEGGCSACNEPGEDDPIVFGTNAALVGVDACPHPVLVGDNALLLSGWSTAPDDAYRLLISGIAQVPVRIDSVIIVHRRANDGPTRLAAQVQDLHDGSGVVLDVPAGDEFQDLVITDAGVVEKPAGSAYGTFQLQLQAHGGGVGPWILDEVRIVVTEFEQDLHTTVTELTRVGPAGPTTPVDLLGRELRPSVQNGMSVRAGSIIVAEW